MNYLELSSTCMNIPIDDLADRKESPKFETEEDKKSKLETVQKKREKLRQIKRKIETAFFAGTEEEYLLQPSINSMNEISVNCMNEIAADRQPTIQSDDTNSHLPRKQSSNSIVSIDSESKSIDLDSIGSELDEITEETINNLSNNISNNIFNTSIKGSFGISAFTSDVTESTRSEGSVKEKRRSVRLTKDDIELLPELAETLKIERLKEWASGLRRCDPRYKIMKYFDDAATLGINHVAERGSVESNMLSPILRMFAKSSCFTVWRPTSSSAIRKMILGEGVGKGLDIKGKSAKKGHLSGYVPFLQIHEESHKDQILTLPKDSLICIFFQTAEFRDTVAEHVALIGEEMLEGFQSAQKELKNTLDSKAKAAIMEKYMWEMIDPEIVIVDEYADSETPAYGIEIPERLFWEAFVMRRDITRDDGSKNETGRVSQPAFQDMNFASLRRKHGPDEPRPVIYQYSKDDPMEARDLIIAYEEDGRVVPVVSDFDCFLVGTRSVSYDKPIPDDQVSLVNKCLANIEKILGEGPTSCSWTEKWLEILKEESKAVKMPRYGYGDPKSISLIAMAVKRLVRDGSVRHGAECFNYTFPQDLDERFLVIGQGIDEKGTPWKYVDREGLQELLMAKIMDGFTFPLNPKWILCDPGWKKVYDALKNSTASHVQSSLDCWYPRGSGIREKIEKIHRSYPNGFVRKDPSFSETKEPSIRKLEVDGDNDGTAAMDLAQHELERDESIEMHRAKMKLKVVMVFMSLLNEKRRKREEKKGKSQPLVSESDEEDEEEVIPLTKLIIRTSDQYMPSEIDVVKKLSLMPRLIQRKSTIIVSRKDSQLRKSTLKRHVTLDYPRQKDPREIKFDPRGISSKETNNSSCISSKDNYQTQTSVPKNDLVRLDFDPRQIGSKKILKTASPRVLPMEAELSAAESKARVVQEKAKSIETSTEAADPECKSARRRSTSFSGSQDNSSTVNEREKFGRRSQSLDSNASSRYINAGVIKDTGDTKRKGGKQRVKSAIAKMKSFAHFSSKLQQRMKKRTDN